jgi:DNA processing protein
MDRRLNVERNSSAAQVTACDGCLRRSALLAAMAHFVARSLDASRKVPLLLALPDDQFVAAVGGEHSSQALGVLEGFDAARARRNASAAGLEALCRHDEHFPRCLAQGADAPRLLYLAGDARLLGLLDEAPAVALVGSRRATGYGLEVAHALGRELGACQVPVVSGMALGVDSAAHEGALEGGGPTVAVLAGGADVPYPRSKRRLYRRIVERGLVVAELPPGFGPLRWCFPARNRIMAGLSAMTVVVEGAADSGSRITAQFAADLGREVGAVPGQVTSRLAEGPNALLADGACVVRSATDVLDALYGAGHSFAGERPQSRPVPDLDSRLAELLAAVEGGAGCVDRIARSPQQTGEVMAGLGELELLGLVRRAPDGSYVRRA